MIGYYGKIPAKGDFISKGIPADVVDTLHEFFAEGLKQSADSLEDEWITKYSVAPLWLFYLQQNIISDQAWLGIMMPSVDRVNRHFPFIVLEPVNTPISNIGELGTYETSIFQLENLMLSLLEPDSDIDAILSQINSTTFQANPNLPSTLDSLLTADGVDNDPEPTNDFEEFLLNKINSLEEKLNALIAEKEDEKTKEMNLEETAKIKVVKTTDSLQENCNLALNFEKLENETILENEGKLSFWLSAGNEYFSPQLIMTKQLPEPENLVFLFEGYQRA